MIEGGIDTERGPRIQQVVTECIRRRVAGETLSDEQILQTHSDLRPELDEELAKLALVQTAERRASSLGGGLIPGEAVGLPPTDSFPGYEVTGEIHRGGQGIVYQAMQKSTQRVVAIKVMNEGPFAGPGDKARFEREIQVLSCIKHPSIVTIHDSGSAAGSAYFVMDYVAGAPLDEFTAAQERSIAETLRLFVKICDALNAAHVRGIIHRDLKPSNIRVDAAGEPHMLDFGLAKIATGDEAPRTLTVTGQFVGSLPWASPEQAEGAQDRVDMRTDIYSLGVILYQMLTGRFPYQVTGNVRDVIDSILKIEPTRPRIVRKQIDDEVETIVLKCLAKESERRYQTAGELARDIRLYLAGDPIEAKRDSVGYVLRKQLRRYRLPAAIAVGFVVVVRGGFVTSVEFWRRAVRERDAAIAARSQAQRQAENAAAANNFLHEVLSLASPAKAVGRQITVRDAVDIAAGNISALTAGHPETEAPVRTAVGQTYHSLGQFDLAVEQLRLALEIRRRELGAEHPDTLSAMRDLGGVLGNLGRMDEAISILRQSLTAQRRILGYTHRDTVSTCNTLAWFLYGDGQTAEAEPLFREALDGFRINDGPEAPSTFKEMSNLAAVLIAQDKLAEAEPLAIQGAAGLTRMLGARHPDTLYAMSIRAWYLLSVGRLAEVEPLFRGVVQDATEVLGADHPHRLYWLGSLAWCLLKRGQLDEAERLFTEALTTQRRVLPDGHAYTFESSEGLARTLIARGRFDEAERLAADSYHTALARYGPAHSITTDAAAVLADLYDALDDPQQAAEWRAKMPRAQAEETPTGDAP